MQPHPRGPLPDEVLPSLVRFAELMSPELFRDTCEDDKPAGQIEFDFSVERAAPSRGTVPVAPAPVVAPLPRTEPKPSPAPIALPAIANPTVANPIKAEVRPARPLRRRLLAAGLLLALGAAGAGGLIVATGFGTHDASNTVASMMPPEATLGAPQSTAVTPNALHWWTLREAFDRIGFDLESVASGSAKVPRVVLVTLPNDLDGIGDPDARKDLFLRAFLPVVLAVNEHILDDRTRLADMRAKVGKGGTLTGDEVQWLLGLADRYDQPDIDLDALLQKVDAIPPSLALAQAIEESGWGTSRIAKGQNAMFGQFGEDPLGAWDYRAFDSLSAAVESYARNLNTHRAYKEFRQARARMRDHGNTIDAFALAATLFRYSERGMLYVKNLRFIIRDNDLRAFDSAHLDEGEKVAVIASNDDARDFDLRRP
jgi:Bax protein